MKDEALKQALEFVEANHFGGQDAFELITAIKQALAEPVPEPVAWVCEGFSSDEKHAIDYWQGDVDDLPIGTQLYTTPPAAKPANDYDALYAAWLKVGADVKGLNWGDFVAKLKEQS